MGPARAGASVRLRDPELGKVFRAECEERLARVEQGLASGAPRAELLREAHGLKGAARMAGLEDVAHLAHCLEDALSDERASPAATARSTRAAISAIRELVRDATRFDGRATPPLVVTPVPAPPQGAAGARATARGPMLVDPAALDRLLAILDDVDAAAPGALARLREAVLALAHAPFGSIAKPLQRAALEHARSRGKDVYLMVEGADERLDPSLLGDIKEPLVHLVQNAIDHGIETPEERRAADKIATGLVTVSLQRDAEGAWVFEVSDDGRGVDEARVLAAAAARGLDASGGVEPLLFAPGFSTRDDVTETCGRGVGLYAVRAAAERLGGTIAVESTPGRGCAFRLRVPPAGGASRPTSPARAGPPG
jgi:chemotaxis protein histidine kinase CheA